MSPWSLPARPLLLAALAAGWLAPPVRAGEVKLPPSSALVLIPDSKTVVAAAPGAGALLYIDAAGEKLVKTVEVDFQPLALAAQGKTLFASGRGSGVIHVLDLETGKEKAEFKLPGEPVRGLACHPAGGLLYATTRADEVFAIDPVAKTVTKTKARGQMIAVDPSGGKFVYTGVQSPIVDQLVLEDGPNKQVRVSLATTGAQALMLKFAAEGTGLKLVAFQDNAALNGKALAVSADGRRVAMAGGGGWVSKSDGRFNYGVAVFETSDMKTMTGEVACGAYPYSVSFHPVLNTGVVVKRGNELIVSNGKSLAKRESFKAPGGEPAVIVYPLGGTKVAHLVNSGTDSVLSFHPLTLTDADREALKAAYPPR